MRFTITIECQYVVDSEDPSHAIQKLFDDVSIFVGVESKEFGDRSYSLDIHEWTQWELPKKKLGGGQ